MLFRRKAEGGCHQPDEQDVTLCRQQVTFTYQYINTGAMCHCGHLKGHNTSIHAALFPPFPPPDPPVLDLPLAYPSCLFDNDPSPLLLLLLSSLPLARSDH